MQNFNKLKTTISQLHKQLQKSAVNAVNQILTTRNWLTGYYIVVKYNHIKINDKRSLFKCRQFYLYYPQLTYIIRAVLPSIFPNVEKVGSVFPQSKKNICFRE